MKTANANALYKTLGVRAGATTAEIRSAFRKKAKTLHPDATGKADKQGIEAFHDLVYAYNTLLDIRSRSLFGAFGSETPERDTFDYHKWLLAREDDESRAKLIFWDLMHGREDEAAAEYCRLMFERTTFSLKHWFTREDFMDLGYILAEELHSRRHYYEAFCLLTQIITMEREKPYFRLFFPDVTSFAIRIMEHNIENGENDELILDAYEKALEMQFGKKEDVYFLTRMASIYSKIGDERTAALCSAASARIGGKHD